MSTPDNLKLSTAAAGRLVIIVALKEVVANVGELIVPASGEPFTVICELTNSPAVKLSVYEI